MRFSANAISLFTPKLNLFHDFSETKLKELGGLLAKRGFELDSWEQKSYEWERIVAGKVLKIETNSKLKKLRICTVEADRIYTVLCGAPLIEENKIYGFAKPGARIGTITLEKKNIGGFISEGMLCSGEELGFNSKQLFELSEQEYSPGDLLDKPNSSFKNQDLILNISVTTNRPDCLSTEGIAREFHCMLGGEVNNKNEFLIDGAVYDQPIRHILETNHRAKKLDTNIRITNNSLKVLDFAYVVLENPVDYYPILVDQILSNLGHGIINPVVNIINFFTIIYGQPFHAYDLEKMGTEFLIENVCHGQNTELIGNISKNIGGEVLVLSDQGKVCSVLGLIGAEFCKIDKNSKLILIECANFSPESIAKSENLLAMKTNASYRFIRTIACDTFNVFNALLNFLKPKSVSKIIVVKKKPLLDKYKTIGKSTEDIPEKGDNTLQNIETVERISEQEVFLSSAEFFRLTHVSCSIETQIQILKKEGYDVTMIFTNQDHGLNKNLGILVKPPFWRSNNISDKHIISEILRLGTFQITPEPIKFVANQKIDQSHWQQFSKKQTQYKNFENRIRNFFSQGFNEIKSFIFCEKSYLYGATYTTIENPFDKSMGFLQNSLIPSIIYNTNQLLDKGQENGLFFEIGTAFKSEEKNILVFYGFGTINPGSMEKNINSISLEFIMTKTDHFLRSMGLVPRFQQKQNIGLEKTDLQNTDLQNTDFYMEADFFCTDFSLLCVNGKEIGYVGTIKKTLAPEVVVCSIDINLGFDFYNEKKNEIFIGEENSFFVDISVEHKRNEPIGNLVEFGESLPRVKQCWVHDLFFINEEKQSVTLRFVLSINDEIGPDTKKQFVDFLCEAYVAKFSCLIR